jgi:hypothetical protein
MTVPRTVGEVLRERVTLESVPETLSVPEADGQSARGA